MFLHAKYRETDQSLDQNIRSACNVQKAEQGRLSDLRNGRGIRQKTYPLPIISIVETESTANDEYNRKTFSGVFLSGRRVSSSKVGKVIQQVLNWTFANC